MTPDTRELKKVLDGITSGVKNVVSQCIEAGKLLSQMKSKAKDGDWKLILDSVNLSWSSADRYMALWEHRSELNLKEVKSLSDAYKIVSAVSFKISKPADTDKPKSTTYKSKTAEQPVPNTTRPAITADTDNSRFYITTPVEVENEDADAAEYEPDPSPTKLDAEIISEVRGYPINRTLKMLSEAMDDAVCSFHAEWFIKVGGKPESEKRNNSHELLKKNTASLIRELCQAYKVAKGKTYQTMGKAGAGQVRRWIEENGMDSKDELIQVLKAACVKNSFYCDKCHRLPSFIKFYGIIRNEVTTSKSPDGNQIRETIHVRSL